MKLVTNYLKWCLNNWIQEYTCIKSNGFLGLQKLSLLRCHTWDVSRRIHRDGGSEEYINQANPREWLYNGQKGRQTQVGTRVQ